VAPPWTIAPVPIPGGEENWGVRGPGGVPQTERDGDDWQVVRPRRGKALRQDEHGQDGQHERKQLGGFSGNGIRRSRSRVNSGSGKTADNRGSSRVSLGYREGAFNSRRHSASMKPHQTDADRRVAVAPYGQSRVAEKGREDDIADSSFKQFCHFLFYKLFVTNVHFLSEERI